LAGIFIFKSSKKEIFNLALLAVFEGNKADGNKPF